MDLIQFIPDGILAIALVERVIRMSKRQMALAEEVEDLRKQVGRAEGKSDHTSTRVEAIASKADTTAAQLKALKGPSFTKIEAEKLEADVAQLKVTVAEQVERMAVQEKALVDQSTAMGKPPKDFGL